MRVLSVVLPLVLFCAHQEAWYQALATWPNQSVFCYHKLPQVHSASQFLPLQLQGVEDKDTAYTCHERLLSQSKSFKVIPQYCIAHLYCARFSASIIISAQMHMETSTIASLYIIYHQESLVKPAFVSQESQHHHHQILEENQGISEVLKDEWPMEKT